MKVDTSGWSFYRDEGWGYYHHPYGNLKTIEDIVGWFCGNGMGFQKTPYLGLYLGWLLWALFGEMGEAEAELNYSSEVIPCRRAGGYYLYTFEITSPVIPMVDLKSVLIEEHPKMSTNLRIESEPGLIRIYHTK